MSSLRPKIERLEAERAARDAGVRAQDFAHANAVMAWLDTLSDEQLRRVVEHPGAVAEIAGPFPPPVTQALRWWATRPDAQRRVLHPRPVTIPVEADLNALIRAHLEELLHVHGERGGRLRFACALLYAGAHRALRTA